MGKRKLLNAYEKELIARYEQYKQGVNSEGFSEEEIVELCNCYCQKCQDAEKAWELVNWGLLFYPSSATLYSLQADLYFEERNFPEATKALRKSLSLEPYNVENWLYLYEVYLNEAQYADEDFFWGENGFKNYLPTAELPNFYRNLIELLENYSEQEKALFLYFVLLEIQTEVKYIPKILLYTYKFKAYSLLQNLLERLLLSEKILKSRSKEFLWRALAFASYYNQDWQVYQKSLAKANSLSRSKTQATLNLDCHLVIENLGLRLRDFLDGISRIYIIERVQYGLLCGIVLAWEQKFSECRKILRPLLSQNSKFFHSILYLIIDTYNQDSPNRCNLLNLLDKHKAPLNIEQYTNLLRKILNIYSARKNYKHSIICCTRLLQVVKSRKLRTNYYQKLITSLIKNQEYHRAYKQALLAKDELKTGIFSLYPIAIEIITGISSLRKLKNHKPKRQKLILFQILSDCDYL